MAITTIEWTGVESKSALASVLLDEVPMGHVETADANTWGFFCLPNGEKITVGYANLGLVPIGIFIKENIFVGVCEIVACFNSNNFEKKFSYRMPCVFHEFIFFSGKLILRDEIGFINISFNGDERWKYLTNGPIDKFEINENFIKGTTIDDEGFYFSI
ncbi:hypothetical protein O3301_23435 [Janthinobacterium sp. SUN211]|uniref:hypothetical protein n=1 Tax=Janthinobacterium sp. SUN211 TaxID=3014786 RepID=UPI0027137F38|nr:hypothetical protein [Janthinobacterium sp. SUN211]MDO8051426.1 hypothetical protein [Janthinobacterium sp. SUN211]